MSAGGIYNILTKMEDMLETGVLFFGVTPLPKSQFTDLLRILYSEFPHEIKHKGDSYFSAMKIELAITKGLSVCGCVFVVKSKIQSYIDEIYSQLPQDIKNYC